MSGMETQQNTTFDVSPKDVKDVNIIDIADITIQQQTYIDFCAIGGLITDEDGIFTKVTADELANSLGVDRTTLYRWKKIIPNFDLRVRSRRLEISKGSRATKVYNGLYLRACKGDPMAVRLWAEIFDDYQPAPQRMQHSLGDGFAEAATIARKRREERAQAIEGKVVDENKAL